MAGNQTQKTNNRIISCAIFLQPGIVVLICFIILSFGANWTRLYMSIFLLIGFYFTTWSLIRYYTTKINTNNNEYYIQSGLINKITNIKKRKHCNTSKFSRSNFKLWNSLDKGDRWQ